MTLQQHMRVHLGATTPCPSEASGSSLSCSLCPADLINVFEVFLPQLLLYPNPTDPLNGDAAALLMREPSAYSARVKGGLLGIRLFKMHTRTAQRPAVTDHRGVATVHKSLDSCRDGAL